jgi:hypothetical protein
MKKHVILMVVLAGAMASANAATILATTAASDGGFDGAVDGWDPQVKPYDAPSLNAGNYSSTYARSDAIFMFDMSNFEGIVAADVIQVTLKYYVIDIVTGTNTTAVDHILKISKSLDDSEWIINDAHRYVKTGESELLAMVVGDDSAEAGEIAAIDVTAAFLEDLAYARSYSSFRLFERDALQYPACEAGSQVASSENTSEYLVPTLVVEVIPEPATMGLLAAGGLALLRKKR